MQSTGGSSNNQFKRNTVIGIDGTFRLKTTDMPMATTKKDQLFVKFSSSFMGQPTTVKGFLPWDGNHSDKPIWGLIKNMLNGQHQVGTMYDVTGTWKHHDFPSLGTSRQDIVVSSFQVVNNDALPPLPPGIVCQAPYGSLNQSAMRSSPADHGVQSRGHVQQSTPAATSARGSRRGSVEQIHVGMQDMSPQDGLPQSQDIAGIVDHEGEQGLSSDFDVLRNSQNRRRQSLQHLQSSLSWQGTDVLDQLGANARRTDIGSGGRSSSVPIVRSSAQRPHTQVPTYLDDVGDEYFNLSPAEQASVDVILKKNFIDKYGQLNLSGSTSSAPIQPVSITQEPSSPGSDVDFLNDSGFFPSQDLLTSSNVKGKQPLRSDSGSLAQDHVADSPHWDMSSVHQLWNSPSRPTTASSGTGGPVDPGPATSRQPLQDITKSMNSSDTAGTIDNIKAKRGVGRPRKGTTPFTSIKRAAQEISDSETLTGRRSKRTAFTRSAERLDG
ncbi:hypothetical protein BGZ91_005634 [Linnemannia elongata]|nr:hypothetical protein BGZ91_005634 [Linnemannia elongata]